MKPEDSLRFPSQCVTLKDGREALIRPLAAKDGEALGDFYEAVPPEDFQFYCPHALTRAKAREKAESAMAPRQVVLVLEAGIGSSAVMPGIDGKVTMRRRVCSVSACGVISRERGPAGRSWPGYFRSPARWVRRSCR